MNNGRGSGLGVLWPLAILAFAFGPFALRPAVPRDSPAASRDGAASAPRSGPDADALLDEASGSERPAVEALVALVPDPVDSHVRWLYDPIVESIQAAAATAEFTLDRFVVPDFGSDPARASDHEIRPGVILFRKEDDARKVERLLVVLLVPEVPTFGIHPEAFARAADFVVRRRVPLRILGPTYSGSVSGLRAALEDAALRAEATDGNPLRVRIVSGSATRKDNAEALEVSRPELRSSFRTTILPDEAIVDDGFLARLRRSSFLDSRTVLLRESNTSFGQGYRKGRFLEFPFPMHVSRLAGLEPTAAAGSGSAPQDGSRSRVSFESPERAADRVPAATPLMTAAGVETALSGLLDAASRSRAGRIGIVATDTRDTLFLAREIRRRMPGPLLFTTDADLLYVHPQFGAFMRGTIVASSYPLFPDTQVGLDVVRQFSNTAAQGIYNAALALLLYDERGTPLEADGPFVLADYVPIRNAEHRSAPARWIGVVGRGGIWPLERRPLDAASIERIGSVFTVESPAPSRRVRTSGLVARGSHPAMALLVLIGALALVGSAGMAGFLGWWSLARIPGWMRGPLRAVLELFRPRPVSAAVDPREEERGFHHARYVLCVGFPSVLVLAVLTALLVAWSRTAPYDATNARIGGWIGGGAAAAGLGAGLLLGAFAITGVTRRIFAARASTPGGKSGGERFCWTERHRGGTILIGAAAVGAGFLLYFLRRRIGADPFDAAMFYARATHLVSWVSPLTPIFLVIAPIAGWGVAHLVGLRRPHLIELDASMARLAPLVPLLRASAARATGSVFRVRDAGPTSAVPTSAIVSVAIASSTLGMVWLIQGVGSVEGRAFLGFYFIAWVIAESLLGLSVAQAIGLWVQLRRVLAGMSHHSASDAFRRLHAGRFIEPLTPVPPRLEELESFVLQARELASVPEAAMAVFGREYPALVPALSGPKREILAAERQAETRPRWLQSSTYTALDAAAGALFDVLRDRWSGRLRTPGPDNETARWLDRAEEYGAGLALLHVREVLARSLRLFAFASAGQAVLLCSHLFFPFQSRNLLLTVDWILILSTLAAAWITFFQAERDAVLSLATNQTPGKTDFSWELARRVIVYGLLPLLSYFAIQFPEAASGLVGWLDRIKSSLP